MNGFELSEKQRRASDQFLSYVIDERKHIILALVGAHSHGFASPDSDVDFKGVHILPTEKLLGLGKPKMDAQRLETVDGIEMDYSSNEIGTAAGKLLSGGGNFLEIIMSSRREAIMTEPLEELRSLAIRNLSQRYYKHYKGFAIGQHLKIRDADNPTIKSRLYVIRLCLTGATLLLRGEVKTDIFALCDDWDMLGIGDLVAAKTTEHGTDLDPTLNTMADRMMARSFEILEMAKENSVLPAEPPAQQSLESWLINLRKSLL